MPNQSTNAHWIRATEPNPQGRTRAIAAARSYGNSFVIKCDDPGPDSVYVHLLVPDVLGGDFDDRELEYSIDGGPSVIATWTYLEKGVALLSHADRFLLSIREARQFACTATAANGAKHNYRFDIAGAAAAIDFVSRVCGGKSSDGESHVLDDLRLSPEELATLK